MCATFKHPSYLNDQNKVCKLVPASVTNVPAVPFAWLNISYKKCRRIFCRNSKNH